jgi:L-rhamnose-H+ transport protein
MEMNPQILGMTLVCFAGVAGGVFAFPLRVKGRYADENTLLGAYVLALVVIPLAVAWAAFPTWPGAFAGVPLRGLAVPFACGLGWGLAAVAYAQGISRIGLSLTVSTVMGITLALGSLIPLASRWAPTAAAVRGWILAGIAVSLAGIVFFGVAGRLRDRAARQEAGRSFLGGFLWCVVSGLLSPLANIGFDAGAPIVAAAESAGAGPFVSPMLGWFPTYAGGLLVMASVFGARLVRNGTLARYIARGTVADLLRTLVMGVLHFLGQVPYGVGAWLLGTLGTSIGWGATIGSQLLAANGLGVALGEWRGAPRRCRWLIAAGIAVTLVAVAMLARASALAAG